MRRKDREVQDLKEIFDILDRCDTVRIAVRGTTHPYIVPVSFGAEMTEGVVTVWFHCARQGLKTDLLQADPRVCVEADRFIRTDMTDHGITTRYESVIGRGTFTIAEDRAEILHGLRLLCEHYGYPDYDLADCRALQYIHVGKIILDEITGKRNLPPD